MPGLTWQQHVIGQLAIWTFAEQVLHPLVPFARKGRFSTRGPRGHLHSVAPEQHPLQEQGGDMHHGTPDLQLPWRQNPLHPRPARHRGSRHQQSAPLWK